MSQTPPNTSSSREAEHHSESQPRASPLSPRHTPLPASAASSPRPAGRTITESSQRRQSVSNTTGTPNSDQSHPQRSMGSTPIPAGLFGRARASSSSPGPSNFGMVMMENPIPSQDGGSNTSRLPALPTTRVALQEEIFGLEGRRDEARRQVDQARERLVETESRLDEARRRLFGVTGRRSGGQDDLDVPE